MDARARVRFLLFGLLVLTTALYWPGLSGPYLLDDFWNLTPVEKWFAGSQSWRQALLPNADSIVFSRPVSMASFMFTLWLGGLGTFPVKLGNLLIHLACGLLGWWMLRRALRMDARLSPHAGMLALAGACIWLLHPLHVSTVLYAVQRMTQLSAFFTLASVAVYMIARRQLDTNRTHLATLNLFATVPILMALGVLSKQNAAIAPFLCLIFELAYLSRESPRPRQVVTFFALFALLPTLAVVTVVAINPGLIIDGYRDWGFTLPQRLLTQPRVLLDYIGTLLVPYTPRMGLFTDDFPVSTGLLSPVSTVLSIFSLSALTVGAALVRRRAPSVFAGWFFFLTAHGVESSFLPLEMYYEHRNYLPSFGLFLAIIGLAVFIPADFRTPRMSQRRIAILAMSTLVLALSFATLGRVLIWQHDESIIEQGYSQHPTSLRAALNKAALAINRKDYETAADVVTSLANSRERRHRVVGRLHLAAISCMRAQSFDIRAFDLAVSESLPQLTVYEAQMIKLLDQTSQMDGCRGQVEAKLADGFSTMLAAATHQPESSQNKFVLRELIARLYARAGRWEDAKKQAEIAWQSGGNPPVGALLTRVYVKVGDYVSAGKVLANLETEIDLGDKDGQQELVRLRELVMRTKQP